MANSNAAHAAPLALPQARWKRDFARRLIAWYRQHHRDLPWRRTFDPYHVWVSEIMLQQTQVVTVVPYFERFVAAFPNVRSLAAADEHDVLRHWEGLGYYRRARQLHRAAQVIVAEHGGRFPRDLPAIASLPGIGRYTAGAIHSIAFDRPAPILEANTVRLFSRLVGFRGETSTTAGQRYLWQVAEHILPASDCRTFNQALMELGALVCTPREPRCDECPVSRLCAAHERSEQDEIPRAKPKPRVEAVREAAVVVWRGDKLLLRQRDAGERWAGLWDFFRFELAGRDPSTLVAELQAKVHEQSGLSIAAPRHVATIKHSVTRFRITLDCFAAETLDSRTRLKPGTWKWLRLDELDRYPLSVTGRKLGKLLVSAAAAESSIDRERKRATTKRRAATALRP